MSASADIQNAIAARLRSEGATRAPLAPVVARRTKQQPAEVEAAAAINTGLAIFVLQPLPRRAMQDVSRVFFEDAEIRVRIIETPAKNTSGVDAYMLVDDIAQALHWQFLGGVLAGPLQLASRVTERVEDQRFRIVDVLFSAAYQLRGAVAAAADFTPVGKSAMEDLQAAAIAQLTAAMAVSLPLVPVRDKEIGSRIEQAGHPLSVKVMPPLPLQAMQGLDEVFYERAEIRVKITEFPPKNLADVDAYDVAEDVARALHWQTFGGLLAAPLRISATPTELIEDPASLSKREIDVVFEAALCFEPPNFDSQNVTFDDPQRTFDSGDEDPTFDSLVATFDDSNRTL